LAGNDIRQNNNADADTYDGYGRNPGWPQNRQLPYFSTTDHLNMPRSWLRVGSRTGGFEIATSGTSNTIALGEGVIGISGGNSRMYKEVIAAGVQSHYNQIPQNCLNTKGGGGMFADPNQATNRDDHWLGRRAFENWPGNTQFYTLLPPNSPSCRSNWQYAWISASSNHSGGVNVVFLDGAVRFVTDSVNTQNLNRRVSGQNPDNPPSNPYDDDGSFTYGVWAELGAVNSTTSPSL
jgi:prepilin-type processing-associated H-X9-DG protein